MVDGKEAQMFEFGWVADYPDEQTFLQLYYSKNAGVGGVNSCNYNNPEYDKLYEQAVVLEPSPERDVLYRKMQDIIREDCPTLLEFYPIAFGLKYPWVHGSKPMEYGNGQKDGVDVYLAGFETAGRVDEEAPVRALKHGRLTSDVGVYRSTNPLDDPDCARRVLLTFTLFHVGRERSRRHVRRQMRHAGSA